MVLTQLANPGAGLSRFSELNRNFGDNFGFNFRYLIGIDSLLFGIDSINNYFQKKSVGRLTGNLKIPVDRPMNVFLELKLERKIKANSPV